MRSALAGDESAYATLLKEVSPVLRAVFRTTFKRYQLSASDQEDVIQDVLITLHLRRDQWNRALPLLPWVFAITRNKIIDEVRRRARRRDIDLLMLPLDEVREDMLRVDAAHDADRLLEMLPPRNRRIVSSISIEGYSARELANQLGISEVAVRIVHHRSLKGLAELFAHTCQAKTN